MAGTAVGSLLTGTVDRSLSYTKAWVVQFTADAADGSFPVYTLPTDFAGMVSDISFVFDGTTPPNSLTYVIKDGYAIPYLPGSGTTTITASSGRGLLSQNTPIINGGTITLTGNATNSAKVKVIFYLID